RPCGGGWPTGRPCIAGAVLPARLGRPTSAKPCLATRAARRPRGRKSDRPVTRDVLDQLLATCDAERPADLRDRALLLVAFASGGRRRSEAAALRVANLIEREPVPADPQQPDGPTLPALALRLGRTKTASADQD